MTGEPYPPFLVRESFPPTPGRISQLLANYGFPIPDCAQGFTPKGSAMVQLFVDDITRVLLESDTTIAASSTYPDMLELFLAAGITEVLTWDDKPPCHLLSDKGKVLLSILGMCPEAWAVLVTTHDRALAVRFAATQSLFCTATLGDTSLSGAMCREVVVLLDARGDTRGL